MNFAGDFILSAETEAIEMSVASTVLLK